MKFRRQLFLSLLLFAAVCYADYPLTIIELNSALPEQVLPSIRPLLDPGDKITAARNTLFIRTSPERLQEIRQLLQHLDRPPRRLLITVRRGSYSNFGRDSISGGARLGPSDSRVVIGNPPRDRGTVVRITRGNINTSDDGDQRIQALEGSPAFIYTGTSIAVPERSTIVRGGTVIRQRTTSYRDATQGFQVVPRVNGNMVTLSIHQQYDQPGGGGTIDLQHADSVVSGRLGEWINLGGTSGRSNSRREGIDGYDNRYSSGSLNIQVKVTELP